MKRYIRSSQYLHYWYFTRHGVQPGSVPKGLDIEDIIDADGGSYFLTNRVLTTDELNFYEIKEKMPSRIK